MSKIKHQSAYAKEILNGFGGIRTDTAASGAGAADIRNFRISEGGSLRKRCGWKTIHSEGSIASRGFWSGSVNGIPLRIGVYGDVVYLLEDGGVSYLGRIGSEHGPVHFAYYRGWLYLLDGHRIYVYHSDDEAFREASGYVPLYGYNWHPSQLGEIHEPINLLSASLRIHYFNSSGATVFKLPYYAISIDSVRVDGVLTSNYMFGASGNQFSLPVVAGTVEVAITVDPMPQLREMLHQCSLPFVCGDMEKESLLLYGAPEGYRLFGSASVTNAQLNGSLSCYPDSDPLYCTADTMLLLGDVEHPITSLYRDRDRILACNNREMWSVSYTKERDSLELYRIRYGLGCAARGAELYCNGDPVLVCENGIYRLHATASEPDDFTPTLISAPISDHLSAQFAQNAIVIAEPLHHELWFRDVTDTQGIVWIYNTESNLWYCFDSIRATCFFRTDGEIGFAMGEGFYQFEQARTTDDGKPIRALYRSGYLDFSHPQERKRSLRLCLYADTGGNDTELLLETERKQLSLYTKGVRREAPVCIDRRIQPGRFAFLRFTLTDKGTARARYDRMALYANL